MQYYVFNTFLAPSYSVNVCRVCMLYLKYINCEFNVVIYKHTFSYGSFLKTCHLYISAKLSLFLFPLFMTDISNYFNTKHGLARCCALAVASDTELVS